MSQTEKRIPMFYSRYPKRSPEELKKLLKRSRATASASTKLLRQAARISQLVKKDKAWITYYSSNVQTSSSKRRPAAVAAAAAISSSALSNQDTTGGHCNTNHAVPWIFQDGKPDVESNRVRELIRNRFNRERLEQPESRTEERWDKPRAPGERRRRIVRDKDAPEAPLEPPTTGYTLFVFLMTTKFRHDRGIEAEHSQTAAMQEISKIWRNQIKEAEQEYYNEMALEIRKEYQDQVLEFRATNSFRPSARFIKLGDGQGPWVHKQPDERNALEAEVASYDTVVFPPRPPSKDKEYSERERQSKERRKEKQRLEAKERQARKRALGGAQRKQIANNDSK